MSFITVIGISHQVAAIEFREKFFLNPLEQELFLSELKNLDGLEESFVLSTCNRTEIYFVSKESPTDSYVHQILFILFSIKRVAFEKTHFPHFYVYREKESVLHLLRVSASLGSLVIGEKQILGQVKKSVDLARRKNTMGNYLNNLSQIAIKTGKKAQSETQISVGGTSMGWAAVEHICRKVKNLLGASVLIMGAGKMAEVSAAQLKTRGFESIFILNRSFERAGELAKKVGGESVALCDMKEVISRVDAVICSMGAPHYTLEAETIHKAMKNRTTPLVLVDISLPRNIDPSCGKVQNVSLFSMDDLKEAVSENLTKRTAAISEVELIITNKIDEYYQKIDRRSQYVGCV